MDMKIGWAIIFSQVSSPHRLLLRIHFVHLSSSSHSCKELGNKNWLELFTAVTRKRRGRNYLKERRNEKSWAEWNVNLKKEFHQPDDQVDSTMITVFWRSSRCTDGKNRGDGGMADDYYGVFHMSLHDPHHLRKEEAVQPRQSSRSLMTSLKGFDI